LKSFKQDILSGNCLTRYSPGSPQSGAAHLTLAASI
jgi:hypothetical protein